MDFDKDVIWRVLVDKKATTFAEYGLVFVLIALLVFLWAVATGRGSPVFFQQGRTS